MQNQEDVVIDVVWYQDSNKEVADPKDEIFDSQGRRWIVSYFPKNDGTTQCSLEEALEITRNSPAGNYQVRCHIPHDCCSRVRDLVGDFSDARFVEISLEYLEESVHKTTISLAGIEEFRRLDCLKLMSYGGLVLRHQVELQLEGIEFCSELKQLDVVWMTIPSLAPLGYLELETLDLAKSFVNDLSMVRSRRLVVDAKQLPLVRRALEPPCIVQTICVESAKKDWELLIEMEELQVELENRLRTEPKLTVATRFDLLNSLERGQVILFEAKKSLRRTTNELKISVVRKLIGELTSHHYGHNEQNHHDLNIPITIGDECPEVRDILAKIVRFDSDNCQLSFKELKVLFHHFRFKLRSF